MGCLKFIIKVAIVVLAIIGFRAIGGWDWVVKTWHPFEKPTQESMIEKSKDVADFSKIPEEYEISKSANILGYRAVVAEHNATGQKMIMIEPKNESIFTKEDIKNEKVEEILKDTVSKYKYLPVKFDKIEVTKHGEFNGIGQKIPYAKVRVEISNLPVKDMDGIIGVAELENGKNLIVISVNDEGKYSQIITDAFYKKVK